MLVLADEYRVCGQAFKEEGIKLTRIDQIGWTVPSYVHDVASCEWL